MIQRSTPNRSLPMSDMQCWQVGTADAGRELDRTWDNLISSGRHADPVRCLTAYACHDSDHCMSGHVQLG